MIVEGIEIARQRPRQYLPGRVPAQVDMGEASIGQPRYPRHIVVGDRRIAVVPPVDACRAGVAVIGIARECGAAIFADRGDLPGGRVIIGDVEIIGVGQYLRGAHIA